MDKLQRRADLFVLLAENFITCRGVLQTSPRRARRSRAMKRGCRGQHQIGNLDLLAYINSPTRFREEHRADFDLKRWDRNERRGVQMRDRSIERVLCDKAPRS